MPVSSTFRLLILHILLSMRFYFLCSRLYSTSLHYQRDGARRRHVGLILAFQLALEAITIFALPVSRRCTSLMLCYISRSDIRAPVRWISRSECNSSVVSL